MNNIIYFSPIQIKTLYNSLTINKTKNKLDLILEPLQCMIQIAFIGVSPIGTKLTIQENILYIQNPSIIQPISRWYNSDKKDDIFSIFQVIRRFIKWYNPNNNKNSPMNLEMYELIIKLAVKGFDNLLKTYNYVDNNNIVQVINMYRNLLQSVNYPDFENLFYEKGVNIDEVFQTIIKIYNKELINVIYNTLLLLENEDDENSISNIINGLNLLLSKNNRQIQNWIKVNLIL